MKTDVLLDVLARSAHPVDSAAAGRRFRSMLLLALLATAVASLGLLGVRQDWRAAMHLPMAWAKLAFPLATAILAGLLLWRLVHPGMRTRAWPLALALPAAAMWLAGAVELAKTPVESRASLVLGGSWWQCVAAIAVLSVPACAIALGAVRGMAPTRLRLAGATAGLFAGSVAAAGFSLYCTEMEAAYLGTWYVLGMLVPAAVGALLGRRLLRW